MAFRVGPGKAVSLGSRVAGAATEPGPSVVFHAIRFPPAMITPTIQHPWLGLLRRSDLDLSPAVAARVRSAGSAVANLAGLVTSASLPLAYALEFFETKVDGAMRFGRWFLATSDGAGATLDRAYEEWARTLLGSQPWRSAAVASGELGWRLSGFARAVRDAAARRARLWRLPAGDLYGAMFRLADTGIQRSWAFKSKSLLDDWRLPDYVQWGGGAAPLGAYLRHVTSLLEARCIASWRRAAHLHDRPIPYRDLANEPSVWPSLLRMFPAPWPVLRGHASLCRLRAGLVEVSHLHGRRSSASVRECIGCGCHCRAPLLHVLSACAHWTPDGAAPGVKRRRAVALAVLNATPGTNDFASAAGLASRIELDVRVFWSDPSRGQTC